MHDEPKAPVFDALLEATSEGVLIVDADDIVVAVNDALSALLSQSPDRLRGTPWSTLFDGDVLDLQTLVDAREPVETTLDAVLAADTEVADADDTPVSISSRRAADHVVVTVEDRTTTVERNRYERILENVDDGIYLLDADGRIEYVNQAAIEAHDMTYDREDIVGSFATAVLPASDIEACIDAIQTLIADPNLDSEQVGVTIEDADGSEIPAELNLALLPPEGGSYSGSVGVLRDISERRRRDQMLRVLNRVLRHNLRNDMNVVLGTAKRIENDYPEVDDAYTERIQEVARNLVELGGKARVVQDLTGTETRTTQSADVVPLVEHVLSTYDRPETPGEITFEAPESATASIPPLFEAAVENVVENALDHCEDPTVAVTVERDDEAVTVEVADDGPGIPGVELDALRSETETPLEHASGLGLWLTDWIVEFADGEVAYDVDDGTTVSIVLPIPD